MSQSEQAYDNHAKLVGGYHYAITVLAMTALIWFVIDAVQDFSWDRLIMIGLVMALLLTAFYARVFPLGVQDRVIRLEERMRMERLLPDELQPRISDFTMDQLIGMRFASDAELPELARRVLAGELDSRKAIKQAITHWRADHQRI